MQRYSLCLTFSVRCLHFYIFDKSFYSIIGRNQWVFCCSWSQQNLRCHSAYTRLIGRLEHVYRSVPLTIVAEEVPCAIFRYILCESKIKAVNYCLFLHVNEQLGQAKRPKGESRFCTTGNNSTTLSYTVRIHGNRDQKERHVHARCKFPVLWGYIPVLD